MNRRNYTYAFTILLLLCIIGLTLLSETGSTANPNHKISVVTSLPLVKDIVEKIGGTKVTVESIIQGPSCQHEYEPSAGDMKRLAGCAVFVKLGMGSDVWTDKLASGALNKKARFIDASRGIQTLKVRGLVNPHYWGNPGNVKQMARNILNALNEALPQERPYFTANYQSFIAELEKNAAALKAKAATVANKKFVSYSNAFPYFYQYFGFNNIATVELSCEREVTPKEIAVAAKLIQKQKIGVLVGDIVEPNEPDGLAGETHARKILLWATTDGSNDYLKTLRHNVTTLVEALQ
ncbi:MAG TPA: metal ABC transporter substrate-binding protein [Bacillota bacterium]